MIDIAWSEFLFIALLALVLIGPKELPSVLRNIGRWVGKARAFTKDISAQLELYTHINDSKDDFEEEKIVAQNNEPPIEKEGVAHENTKP